MSAILKQVLMIGLDMVGTFLRGRDTPAARQMAGEILSEMAEEAIRQGLPSLTPEFRAPYERRIIDAWRFLGLVDEV